jgi:glycine dehydrogenase
MLAANHIARRLDGAFPVLYTGTDGLVAHECIIDVRPITAATGITAEDVAKRLIDHGFHAPTLSFPVAGTLMIEPTESEDLAEIERFCDGDARDPRRDRPRRVRRVATRRQPARQRAAHGGDADARLAAPVPARARRPSLAHTRRAKYWPPVRRIDGVRGDRNLVCSCPPLEAFDIAAAP